MKPITNDKPRYVPYREWREFLNNHWRHMTWKVNGMIALMVVIIGILSAILAAAVQRLFGS